MSLAEQKRLLFVFSLAALAALNAGCVSKDMSDLENYTAEVLSRKGGSIEPLPPIKPYERYLYRGEELGLRDPFQSFLEEEATVDAGAAATGPRQQEFQNEIMTHNREELESFELDSLRMVGLLENADALWGIVTDQAGIVHRVTVGNYIGRNYGKITNIQEDRIDIREIVKDSRGQWEERAASLALSEE